MKTILITGASSGIGEEMAWQYAGPEVRLALTGRDAIRLEAVAARCRSKGSEVISKVIDVCDRQAMQEWVSGLSRSFGLDIVVANAGVSGGFGGQDIADITADYRIFDINLSGMLHTIYPALPDMVAKRSGHIVLISSLASFIPMPSAPAYSASKVAVRFYGEALATKLAPYDVKVSIVCPGFIRSRMTDKNEFPMPFLMQTDVAVKRIIAGIEKGAVRIDFPWIMVLILSLISILPSRLTRAIFACLPDKKHLPKT